MLNLDVKLRKSFPEEGPVIYECVDWTPSFAQLNKCGYGSVHEITLKNKATGEFEHLTFEIVEAHESPITTVKWISGKIVTDDEYDTNLTFDYLDGKLVKVLAATTPKSLAIEVMAKRTERISYPAEITTFDIFSPVD